MLYRVVKYIFLHHTADPSGGLQLTSVNAYHKSKGFTKSALGYYVGYNYFVDTNAQVTQTRGEFEVGCHTVTPLYPDANKEGIGICLAGDFTKSNPTPEQIAALAPLLADVQVRHSIPEKEVFLHREVENVKGGTYTTCPGQDLRKLSLANRKKYLQGKLLSLGKALINAKGTRVTDIQKTMSSINTLLAQL